MIVAVCVLAYLAVGLFVARYAYGLMRAKCIDGNAARYPYSCGTAAKAVAFWREVDRVPVMMVAGLLVALWPAAAVLGVAGWGFGRFLDGTPRKSQAELRDQLAAREKRIQELEREAGII